MRFRLQKALALATEEQLRSVIWDTEQNMCWTQPEKSVSEIFHLTVYLHDMTYKAARKELLGLYGVGEKVADCICLSDASAGCISCRYSHPPGIGCHYKRGFPEQTL